MDDSQKKVEWQGEVISIQPRSTVWRYLIDNRTHRECGYNIFLKGKVHSGSEIIQHDSCSDKYDYCVAISEKQEAKLRIQIGDLLQGTGWTKKYPEIEFADYYRAGGIKKLKESAEPAQTMDVVVDEEKKRYDGTAIPRVNSSGYPGLHGELLCRRL